MKKMIQLKNTDLKDLRLKWYNENDGICPILKKPVLFEKTALDHHHALKSEGPTQDGKGCCRGTLSLVANSWEGKVVNSFKRYGLEKETDISSALRNLADYLENNKTNDDVLYIHPSEKPKELNISKRNYNKLKKLYMLDLKAGIKRAKFPEYPKSSKLTVKLEELFTMYKIDPYN